MNMRYNVGPICILTTDYPSVGRPVYVFVEQLVNEWVDKGYQVSVIAPQSLTHCLIRRDSLLPRQKVYVTARGNKYMVYRPYSLSFGKGRKWLYRLVKRFNENGIARLLDSIQPAILYAHFWRNADKLKRYALRKHLPLFVACGEGDNALEEMMASLSCYDKECLVKAVKGVVCVSTENQRKCISYGIATREHSIMLPNAVDNTLFHVTARNVLLRKELGVEENDLLLIFVGSFIHRKGSGILAKAIDKINDPHVKVIFIGSVMPGNEEDPVCNGIVYKGKVEHELLPAYYASADVFVLPTQKEGCSNAIVEALAMGLPVISSKGAFNDDILNDINSIRVNPSDVDEIVEAIIRLRDNLSLRHKLREGATFSAKPLSIDIRAEKVIQFVNSRVNL